MRYTTVFGEFCKTTPGEANIPEPIITPTMTAAATSITLLEIQQNNAEFVAIFTKKRLKPSTRSSDLRSVGRPGAEPSSSLYSPSSFSSIYYRYLSIQRHK
jgi:hypothetical protein